MRSLPCQFSIVYLTSVILSPTLYRFNFFHQLAHNALPVTETLKAHHIQVNNGCQFCDATTEDRDHVFLWCPFSQAVWFGIKPALKPSPSRSLDIDCWLLYWIGKWRKDKNQFQEVCSNIFLTLYTIWRFRNNTIWKWVKPYPMAAIKSIEDQVITLSEAWEDITVNGVLEEPNTALSQLSNHHTTSYLAMNLIQRHGHRWIVAVAVKNNIWDYVFAQQLVADQDQKELGTISMLDFLRNCILSWPNCQNAAVYVFPPKLLQVCNQPKGNWRFEVHAAYIKVLTECNNIRLISGKHNSICWDFFRSPGVLLFIKGFSIMNVG